MSEHRAAAHISGLYIVFASVVTGVIGLIGGWYLRDATPPKLIPESRGSILAARDHTNIPSTENERATNPVDEAAISEKIDFGALLLKNEPKQERAEPSAITMEAYYRLLEDEGVPQLEVAKQYIGKRVKWSGFFHSLDTSPESNALRYRVLLTSNPDRFYDYLYFHQSVHDESQVAKLRNRAKVTVSGVLSGRTTLSDARIESVENTQ